MKLIPKNFSSEKHRILVNQNGHFLNAFYLKNENGLWKTDNFFMVSMTCKSQYKESLQELLIKVENFYGIELIKADLKIAQ